MSTNELPTTLSFKDENGNWIDIPVIYQTAYQAYVAYCVEHEITPVSIEQFYNAYTIFSDSAFLSQLVDVVKSTNTLPVSLGGTGASTALQALTNLGITIGDIPPTEATPGTIYFEIISE